MSKKERMSYYLTPLIGLLFGAIVGVAIYFISSDILIAGIIVPPLEQGAIVGVLCFVLSIVMMIMKSRATSRGNQELGREVEEPKVSPPRPTQRALDLIEARRRGVPLKEVTKERLLKEMEELDKEGDDIHHTAESLGAITIPSILEISEGMGLTIPKRTKKAVIIERVLDKQYLNLSARVELEESIHSEEDDPTDDEYRELEYELDSEVHEALTEKRIKEYLPVELRAIYGALPSEVKFELQTIYVPQMVEQADKVQATKSLEELDGDQYLMPKIKRRYSHRSKEDMRGEMEQPLKKRRVLRRKKTRKSSQSFREKSVGDAKTRGVLDREKKGKRRKNVRKPRSRLDKHKR